MTLGLNAEFGRMLLEQVECDMTQHGYMLCAVANSNLMCIFAKDHVSYPV